MDRAEELWRKCRVLLNAPSGTLLYQSLNFQFRRIYATNNIVYKLVDLKYDASGIFRKQDLAGEFSILRNCTGIPGVPSAIAHHRTNDFEVIVMERLPGEPLSNLTVGWFRLIIILVKLGIILLRLSWRGISHNDINQDNLLITDGNSVSLVDFDQACRVSFLVAVISQFFGISIGENKVQSSTISLIRKHLRQTLSPKTVKALKRLRSRKAIKKIRTLPVLADDASFQLKTLLKAWKMAQESDANAPGQHLAYYSLNLEGCHFPGERCWIDRWNKLRCITDYSGKRILELGCNMSLLSTYLLKYSNVKAAFAVDADAKIIEAAKLVHMAFGVRPAVKVQDFDAPDDWESQLIDFKPDIVFALNVLNWVQDKQRLLDFLGRFAEVVFEGHDSFDVESRQLGSVGFKQINIVGVSERGREIIHCRK